MALKLGVIGTNWITKQFIEAAETTGQYELTAVYSRHEETGQQLLDQLNLGRPVSVFTDLNAMYTSGIDVVYIASPNGLHFEQIKIAIHNQIHVIVEKPAAANHKEFAEVRALLDTHPQVMLFEASRHIHQPNFKAIAKKIGEMEQISGATFVYEKYSSRFDAYLAGEEPNVLTREFAAGALADLGVYPVYTALRLFGVPTSQHYFATLLRNGADGRGTAILRYPNFDVTLQFGKGSTSYQHAEVLGLRDTLIVSNIAELEEVKYNDGRGNETVLSTPAPANPMIAEAEEFAKMMQHPDQYRDEYQDLLQLSAQVNAVLYALRKDAGIVFPNND